MAIRKKRCTSPSSIVAPRSPHVSEKITDCGAAPIQTSYLIGPYNLQYLLFSGIGGFLCHHPYCFPSQSQTLFGIGAVAAPCNSCSQVISSAQKYLRRLLTFDFVRGKGGGGGGGGMTSLF